MADTEHDPTARARFDAELVAADLDAIVRGDDRERLFQMWADFLPQRALLRGAVVEPAQEPTFIEKPARAGGRTE